MSEGRYGVIGLIGAMEIEIADLAARLEAPRLIKIAGMTFREGTLCGQRVVLVRSGVGKVNAAVCTQILADRFGVDAVINTGVAGSLDARIDIGDFVLSKDVMHHDVDATLFGYAPGEVPQLGITAFPADETLIACARQACREAGLPQHLFEGRVVSGDQFIVQNETKQEIIRRTGGMCTEMEGAAIAQTAWLNHLPFLIVRAISDKADESAREEYPVFEERAARRSALMLQRMMEILRRTQ